jgi:hypothetical protein
MSEHKTIPVPAKAATPEQKMMTSAVWGFSERYKKLLPGAEEGKPDVAAIVQLETEVKQYAESQLGAFGPLDLQGNEFLTRRDDFSAQYKDRWCRIMKHRVGQLQKVLKVVG